MEHKHKLLATASSQAQVPCRESVIDRFINLPDEVAHQILSFFNFKQLIRVGSVSKRFRGLYLSSLSLDFWSWTSNKQEQLNMLNSFERFLIHRGDNKIQHFHIRLNLCSSLCDEIFRVITWIHIAARCNVEVLDLQLEITKTDMPTMELPSCIFLCGSLRSLMVDLYTVLKVPSFSGSTNLQYLSLSSVRIDEGFSKWISSSCNALNNCSLIMLRQKISPLKAHLLNHLGLCLITVTSANLTSQVLFKEGSMPAQFDNISYLGMHIGSLSDDLVPAMVSLLRGVPNLNTLHIDSDISSLFHKPKACGCNRKYWKSQNLNFTDQLKEVTIVLSNGFNRMELARYILEQAENLEKMVIFYLPHQSYVIR